MTILLGGVAPVMRDTLATLLEPADQMGLAVSYLQVSGWDIYRDLASPNTLAATRILCDDKMGITNPKAVRLMLEAGVDVRAFSGAQVYHPKLYLSSVNGSSRAMLGSANLSESALLRSVEVGILLEDQGGALAQWFDEMFVEFGAEFDDARLAKLDRAFARRMKSELGYRPTDPPVEPNLNQSHDGRELVDALFSGLPSYIAPLSFDQAGNTIRNFARARHFLAMPPSQWTNKQRSDMKLLGFAAGGQLTQLGNAATSDNTDPALADRWMKWFKSASDQELRDLSGNAALLRLRAVLRKFWSMKKEVRDFFLTEAPNSSTNERPVLQAIELLANADSDVSDLDMKEVRALAPLLGTLEAFPTNVQSAVRYYMKNKSTRDWGIQDRRLVLEAWRTK